MGWQLPSYDQISQGIVTAVTKHKLMSPNTLLAGGDGSGGRGGDGGKEYDNKCLNCGSKEHPSWE